MAQDKERFKMRRGIRPGDAKCLFLSPSWGSLNLQNKVAQI